MRGRAILGEGWGTLWLKCNLLLCQEPSLPQLIAAAEADCLVGGRHRTAILKRNKLPILFRFHSYCITNTTFTEQFTARHFDILLHF